MHILGSRNNRVDGVKNEAAFVATYGISHWQMIVEQETFDKSFILKNDFAYIAFVEPADNSISQLFILEDDDLIVVYAGCGGKDGMGYFNTDGIAFMKLSRKGTFVAMWEIDQSPYDLNSKDDEYEQEMREEATVDLKNIIMKTFKADNDAAEMIARIESGEDKILFVGQL